MLLAQLTVVASAVLGWGDVTIQQGRSDRPHTSLQRSLAGLDRPSQRTSETLRRYDLERRYRRDVPGALDALETQARSRPEPELVYALAELSWIEAGRLERWRKAESIGRYLDVVAYAFDFLFDPALAAGREPTDPRYRLACELYNGGLERILRAAEAKGKVAPGKAITLKIRDGEQALRIELEDKSPWQAADVDQVILASDFEVNGLNVTRGYFYGLGVPLIAVKRVEKPGLGEAKFYPPEMAFPLTAFLQPNSRLRPGADPDAPRECVLKLVDPVTVTRVGVKPLDYAVEADLTTPLAYMWSRTDLDRYRWKGLFRPGSAMGRANLMMLRPWEPNKIPVVMVHGLISTPLAWIPMLNELLGDPNIREHYQFLLYMYPTGVPIPIAAAGLRETLLQAQQMYDPSGADPAFGQMVLLGHSMGGVLSHAMAVDSGNKLWELMSDRSFDKIVGKPEVLGELQHYLFFKPLPFVKRVVFLATPHRGSDFTRNVIGRVGAGLISDPDQISDLLATLIKNNPDALNPKHFRRMPSSIETLDTDHPVLLALLAMTPNPGVAFHSVIGARTAGPLASTTDGVVGYRSSHIDGIDEVVVRSDHGVQSAPEAILEVRRLLLKHLGIEPAQVNAAAAAPPFRR